MLPLSVTSESGNLCCPCTILSKCHSCESGNPSAQNKKPSSRERNDGSKYQAKHTVCHNTKHQTFAQYRQRQLAGRLCQSTPAPGSIPRELHQPLNSSQAGFLTRALPKGPFPPRTNLFYRLARNSGYLPFGLPIHHRNRRLQPRVGLGFQPSSHLIIPRISP